MDESLTTVASAAPISGLDKTAELRRLFEHYSKLQGYDYDEVLRIMNETGFNFTDPEDDIYIFYKVS